MLKKLTFVSQFEIVVSSFQVGKEIRIFLWTLIIYSQFSIKHHSISQIFQAMKDLSHPLRQTNKWPYIQSNNYELLATLA
jgi:hypothetical protein